MITTKISSDATVAEIGRVLDGARPKWATQTEREFSGAVRLTDYASTVFDQEGSTVQLHKRVSLAFPSDPEAPVEVEEFPARITLQLHRPEAKRDISITEARNLVDVLQRALAAHDRPGVD